MAVSLLTGTLPGVLAQAVAVIALGLLAASGVAKFIDPDPTTGAMSAARLPASKPVTYLLGAVEVGVATTALVAGGPSLVAGALLYAGFSAFTFAATIKRIPVQSCGCFGREDTPPSTLHVVFNLVATIGLAATAVLGLEPVNWSLPVIELVMFLGFAALGVSAAYLMLTRLPQLLELASES